MLPSDHIRSFALPEAVLWSCWFFGEGFSDTLHMRIPDYGLNWLLAAYINEVNLMAKKPISRERSYAKSSSGNIQWVNVNLTDADVDAIATWLADEPNLLVEYVRLVGEGYSLGVKPARDGDGVMATLMSNAASEGGGGMGVSAYAPNAYDALGVLLYKFVTLLGGQFPSDVQKGRSRFR